MSSQDGRFLDCQELLDLIPYGPGFRFVDEILSVDDSAIVGTYTFKGTEAFYASHFPGKPITPGVILLESMAQVGVVAFGLYLATTSPVIDERTLFMLFCDAKCEFLRPVFPGDAVLVKAKKIFFRRLKLKVSAVMSRRGEEVAVAEIAGMGVPR